jgi:hypothetical protein
MGALALLYLKTIKRLAMNTIGDNDESSDNDRLWKRKLSGNTRC